MITVTKKFSFCYGHHLPEHKGKCKNPHGHNSEVEVEIGVAEVLSIPNLQNGMLMDFGDLKACVLPIIDKLDHKYLNDALPSYPGNSFLPPTAENLVQYFMYKIRDALPQHLRVRRIRVSETPTSWAEWRA